ncbi:hypothetical protein [Streptomyces sp. GSL17-111]|uniref:hypothetical protein n=1 Tax=Streptomyces sp. GSL17-111 TaxID=3121596 RepID=UPI0030F4B0CD
MTTRRTEPGYDGYDYLDLPLDAGLALLRRPVRTGPVEWDAARARVRLRVPAGSAEELPGLLEWLDWGGVRLDLSAEPGARAQRCGGTREPDPAGVWLRPPEEGRSGPNAPNTEDGPPVGLDADLVRLVSAAATECHRAALHRSGRRQPLAFS